MRNHLHLLLAAFFCNILSINQLLNCSEFSNPEHVTFMIGNSCINVGEFTYISKEIHVREWGEAAPLSIGKFTAIADDVTIFLGGNHRIDWITTYPFGKLHADIFPKEEIVTSVTKGGVKIGNDVWIGSKAIIMSGITVGDGAVIAAHSVVVKDVEPYSIVGGNPAKHIRYRFDADIRQALLTLKWWDFEIDQIKELVPDLCNCPDIEKLNFWIQKYKKDIL